MDDQTEAKAAVAMSRFASIALMQLTVDLVRAGSLPKAAAAFMADHAAHTADSLGGMDKEVFDGFIQKLKEARPLKAPPSVTPSLASSYARSVK